MFYNSHFRGFSCKKVAYYCNFFIFHAITAAALPLFHFMMMREGCSWWRGRTFSELILAKTSPVEKLHQRHENSKIYFKFNLQLELALLSADNSPSSHRKSLFRNFLLHTFPTQIYANFKDWSKGRSSHYIYYALFFS